MRRKNYFVTVFRNLEPVHLTKDVGMIPMAMSKIQNVKSKIIYWKKGCEVENKYDDFVELVPIVASTYLSFICKLIFILFKDKVSIVNFYHMEKTTILLTILMKLFGIKTYIKLDISEDTVNLIELWFKNNTIKRNVLKLFIRHASIISIEEKELKKHLNNIDSIFSKIVYIPNSIFVETVCSNTIVKENIFLIVGRIGAFQKNHELLIEAISKLKYTNEWKFVFAGPVENEKCTDLIKGFSLDNQVEFVGNLSREELFDLYARSKVFVLPSRWEGFSLALLEASYMGCYILSTRVGGVEAVTKNGELGKIIDQNDVEMLAYELGNIIENKNSSVDNELLIRMDFIKGNFDLERNLRVIDWNEL
ncbi:glycosyltransferase family 4 protein [Shewanella sp. S1-49-MNA-CIBAN-0167]|uniref:glycosyltransferase family 4 protein n=1 Tax=Shewanella sp. S1-49-MNA-CIBAN-0167 TaxID=3140468 RepID=UPI00331E4D0E